MYPNGMIFGSVSSRKREPLKAPMIGWNVLLLSLIDTMCRCIDSGVGSVTICW